jgi:hypothetical protein
MPRLTKTALQKHLIQLEKEDLIGELLRLFVKFKDVNEFYQMEFGEDTRLIVNVYKQKIRKIYFPNKRIRKPRSAAVKKLISEFKKVALYEYDVIDLLLYRVENSIEFTNTQGYMSDTFYKSIQTTFGEALQLIAKNRHFKEFKDRCEKCIWFAGHSGYELNTTLQQLFEEYYPVKV